MHALVLQWFSSFYNGPYIVRKEHCKQSCDYRTEVVNSHILYNVPLEFTDKSAFPNINHTIA